MQLMRVPKDLEPFLSVDPEIMHGELCFTGTRIPLSVLLDNLSEGMGLDEFLIYYPTIRREQAVAVLEWEHRAIREATGMKRAG